MESNAEAVQNWNFSRDFPEIGPDLIDRPHFLETIAEVLNQETRIVFLEGDEGDGATTTLAQFCLKHPTHSFSLFIKPASRFAYSPDYLRLALAEQLYWYVNGTALNKETLDISEFDTLVLRMRAKACIRYRQKISDWFHRYFLKYYHWAWTIVDSLLQDTNNNLLLQSKVS